MKISDEKEALMLWNINTFDCEDERGYRYAMRDILPVKVLNSMYEFDRYYNLDTLFYQNSFDTLSNFTTWYVFTKYLPKPNLFILKGKKEWDYLAEDLSYKDVSYFHDEYERIGTVCHIEKRGY